MKKEFSSQRRDTSRANQQLAETDRNTVEPIVHTWEQKKVAVFFKGVPHIYCATFTLTVSHNGNPIIYNI